MSDVILILDDDENDCILTTRTLMQSGLSNPIAALRSCEDGIQYIRSCETDLPRLIILDLDFKGKMDGYSFMKKLRTKPQWKYIPIVVLTIDQGAIARVYGLGAIGFIKKPVEVSDLLKAVRPLSIRLKLVADTD